MSRDLDRKVTNQAVPGPQSVRVAVVQLAYHPAVSKALSDPLFGLHRDRSSLLPDGRSVPPRAVKEAFLELEHRTRDAYLAQLGRRLDVILEQCRAWGARIVVFPEYSIPVALLSRVADRAGDMVVVAGTHFVDRDALRSGIYEKLGATMAPELRNAVCPVLYEGSILGLVAKIHPVEEELRIDLRSGEAWPTIPTPEGIHGPMGILVCRDFLERESESHRLLVATSLAQCSFLSVPSLTPPHSLDEFGSKSWQDARRYGRPVLYANHAPGGGTSVYVDEGRQVELRDFPNRAGYLEPGEEGVIVADVDLGYVRTGKSTRFDQPLPVKPYAAATFVYRSVERAYAQWLDELSTRISSTGEREVDRLDAMSAYLREHPPPQAKADGTRARRLERLEYESDEPTGMARAEMLTRELMLPDDILPLPVLRAALARGAADVVRSWYAKDHPGDPEVTAFGTVEASLKAKADAVLGDAKMKAFSEEARLTVSRIADKVRGRPPQGEMRSVPVGQLDLLVEKLEQGLKAQATEINELYKRGKYEEARDGNGKLAEEVERLLLDEIGDTRRQSLSRLASGCRLNEAGCSLNLGDMAHARSVLPRIVKEHLTPTGVLMLVRVLGGVGEYDRARALLAEERWEGVPAEDVAETAQILDITEGKPIGEIGSSPEVRVLAAYHAYHARDLEAAATHAFHALKNAVDNDLVAAMAVNILVRGLHETVFEFQGVSRYVPSGMREDIVLRVDQEILRLRDAPLPAGLRKELRRAEDGFRRDTQDADWEPAGGAEPAELAGDPSRGEGPPWESGLQRLFELSRAGEVEQVFSETQRLALQFPGRLPIEHNLALLLKERGHFDEARTHARLAFDVLPGIGQRHLLADLLLRTNEVEAAWTLLQPVASREGSTTLHLLAWVAQQRDLAAATQYWRRYVALRPDDARARVNFANHLVAIGRPAEAADVAWQVFNEHKATLGLDELSQCLRYQRVGGLPEARQTERLRDILTVIRDRFSGNAEAELLRVQHAQAAGIDASDTDFSLVMRAPRVTTFEDVESLVTWMKQRDARAEGTAQLLRRGALPVATACSFNGMPMALHIERMLRRRGETAGFFCPAVTMTEEAPIAHLRGVKLLIPHWELLLLQGLDLLADLCEALGETGRILLLRRDFARIVDESVWTQEQKADAADFEESRDAARRARELHAWIGSGLNRWIQILPDPERPSFLPPPRDPDNLVSRKLVSEPLEEALAYRTEMRRDPTLYLLTADFFMSQPPGDLSLLGHLAWKDGEEQIQQFHALLAETVPRDLFLPAVVRLLVRNPVRKFACLRELCELGFADAFGVGEILGLSEGERTRLLGRAEWLARELSTFAGERARRRLGFTYSMAVFRAYGCHGEPPLEARATLATALLARLQGIDEARGTSVVEEALTHLGLLTADHWKAAWKDIPDGLTLRESSAVRDMWVMVSGFIGTDPARRAAYGRAARQVWLALDAHAGDGPPRGATKTLFLAFPITTTHPGRIDFMDAATEVVAILSSCWTYRPLAEHGVHITSPKGIQTDKNFEDILVHGARLLAEENAPPPRSAEGRTVAYGFPIGGESELGGAAVPIEALLLRTEGEARARLAKAWKAQQGPHDGELYALLERIEQEPSSVVFARAYARRASSALFRLVRDDPAYLYTWAHEHGSTRLSGRRHLEELRVILSEPQEEHEAPSILEMLKERLEHGEWSKRADRARLLVAATEVPGTLPVLALHPRLEAQDDAGLVQSALRSIDNCDEVPSARLAGAVLFLRTAAARRPFVHLPGGSLNLREVLPDHFSRLLDRLLKAPEPDTLAAHEPALLQVCATIVQRISEPGGLPIREGLWLTWRLFQWLCQQLAAMDPDARRDGMKRLAAHAPNPLPEPADRLDPFGFGRDRFDIRLAAVLHALCLMEEVWRQFAESKPHTVSSKELEENLLKLASGHPEGPSLPSVLDWDAPGTVPDLALLALLRVKLSAFGSLPAETRKRHFASLPEEPDPEEPNRETMAANRLPDAIIHAVSVTAQELAADERLLLIERLRAMKDGPTSRRWRWVAFTGLFVAGEASLDEELRGLFVAHADDRTIEPFLGLYLLAVAHAGEARLLVTVDTMVEAFMARGASPIAVALGLGQVFVHGKPEMQQLAKDKLAALARVRPFCEDERVQELAGFLGLARGGHDG